MDEEVKKNKGGRPVTWTDARIEELCDDLEEWLEFPNNFWIKDFIFEWGFHKETWATMKERSKRLEELVKKAKLKQENYIVKCSLLNKFNSNMSQFLLKTNHKEDYSEDSEKSTIINVYSKNFKYQKGEEVNVDEVVSNNTQPEL